MGQFAVAKDRGFLEALHGDLFDDFAGSGQRFDKDHLFITDRIRNDVQILQRERQVFGERAVVGQDAQDSAAFTMPGEAAFAKAAGRAKSERVA